MYVKLVSQLQLLQQRWQVGSLHDHIKHRSCCTAIIVEIFRQFRSWWVRYIYNETRYPRVFFYESFWLEQNDDIRSVTWWRISSSAGCRITLSSRRSTLSAISALWRSWSFHGTPETNQFVEVFVWHTNALIIYIGIYFDTLMFRFSENALAIYYLVNIARHLMYLGWLELVTTTGSRKQTELASNSQFLKKCPIATSQTNNTILLILSVFYIPLLLLLFYRTIQSYLKK